MWLKKAFMEGAFVVYGSKLGRVRWTGDQVDVYMNKIRQLTRVSWTGR